MRIGDLAKMYGDQIITIHEGSKLSSETGNTLSVGDKGTLTIEGGTFTSGSYVLRITGFYQKMVKSG